jgi:hypothetical protein
VKYFKSIIKITCTLLISVAALFAFCGSLNIFALAEKLPITCFESLPDINLKTNAMDDFSNVSEAFESLYKKYPSIKVNNTDDTVSVDGWMLANKSLAEKYNNKIPGEYSFFAFISSEKYDVYSIENPPAIKIILSEPEKISSFELEQLADIKISNLDTADFKTKEEAEKSILKKYDKVKIKNSQDFLKISDWKFTGGEYSASKAGSYEFSAVFSESEKYDISKCMLKINLIIINEKKKITNFASFEKITLTEIYPSGWKSLEDAENTLISIYKSISVNWGEGTVPIVSWNLSGGNYDSSRNGSYFFMPRLGDSDIYDTKNLGISPSPIEVIFNIPYGYASIYLYDSYGNGISNAALKLENDDYSFYGESDKNGSKIFYAPEGEYNVSVYYDGKKILKTIIILKEKITYLKIKLNANDTEKTSTSKSVSKTEIQTTTQSISEKISENLWQNGNILCETQTSNGFNIKIEADEAYVSNIPKDAAEEEFKSILKAVLSINFTKTSKKAKTAAEKAFLGLEANILPVNFSFHKDFAFPVKISVSIGNKVYPQGEYFLYYYNSQTGDFEDCGKAFLNDNGLLCFEISHCSDYFISDKQINLNTENSIVLSESNAKDNAVSFLNVESQKIQNNKDTQNQHQLETSNIPVKIIFQEKADGNENTLLLLINIAFILFAVLYLKRNAK